ncbi:MAG: alpha/beta fold hydrolase [Spirochaetota bacterium]
MKKILVYIACNFIILVIAVAVIGAASRDHSEMPEHLKGSYIDISGLRIRYVQKGKGRDVLFIHGSPGSIEDWSPLAEDLSSQFRLTCYDRPGQGFSGTPNESFHLENNARIAFRLIEKLGLIDPIVVGHSYGGSTVLAMAVAGPANVGPFVTIGAGRIKKRT